MFRSWNSVPIVLLLCMGIGCDPGPHSSTGFRLPPSGETERGRLAFVAHDCYGCHVVAGENLPRDAKLASTLVLLGGAVPRQTTDGYLVTSIIYPSHAVTRRAIAELGVANIKSRMPDYTEKMTVRELTDIVAFLQTKYTVQQAPRFSSEY